MLEKKGRTWKKRLCAMAFMLFVCTTPLTAAAEESEAVPAGEAGAGTMGKEMVQPDTVSVEKDGAEQPPTGYTGWWNANGQEYWYERGIKQGTEGRGKEIYDPATDAWYWLDAVSGGAKAKNKDVYQESNGGKWVRYDENGRMVKGEDCRDGEWYYFEPVTGAMVKGPVTLADGRSVFYNTGNGQMLHGEHYINNQIYRFDMRDGNLRRGQYDKFWVRIDGKDYWYENWQRLGWNPADPFYRGKEIYDPVSNAWYWLDNVYQGAKAVSKDVYQESHSAYPDRPDGTGKWVRYDANGRMVKGWQYTSAGTYYFEPVTGSMAKGYVPIDGTIYYFNEITGIRRY